MNRIITSFLVLLCGAGVYAEGEGCDMNQYDEALCKMTMDTLRKDIDFNKDMINHYTILIGYLEEDAKLYTNIISLNKRFIKRYGKIKGTIDGQENPNNKASQRYGGFIDQYKQRTNEYDEIIKENNKRLKRYNDNIDTAKKQIKDDKDDILQYEQVAERMKMQQQVADAYALLELQEGVSVDEIRRQYKQLALKWHPDKLSEEEKPAAREKMIALIAAHDLLTK